MDGCERIAMVSEATDGKGRGLAGANGALGYTRVCVLEGQSYSIMKDD